MKWRLIFANEYLLSLLCKLLLNISTGRDK
ncbi:MAG: hypothetical protein RLZZ196_3427 [Bacteroidota bacterium]|jgi:hypothetical protein